MLCPFRTVIGVSGLSLWVENMISWVLLALSNKSKSVHCLEIISISLKYDYKSSLLDMQPMMHVSSAYLMTVILLSWVVILFVYMENNRGLRTEPWGVPVLVVMGWEITPSTIVLWTLLLRKLDIHSTTEESRCSIWLRRLDTLIVLKADEKSKNKHLA